METPKSQRRRLPRPQGTPVMLRLWGLAAIPAILISLLLGTGSLAIMSGLIAVFTLMALSGGALLADLKLAAALGPLIAAGTIGPRLLSEVSRPGAIAALTVMLFLAALLPLRGSRFTVSGVGLGMASLFAYGYPALGGAGHSQVVTASLTGIVTAVLVRIARGLRDPSGGARARVADLLDTSQPSTPDAYELWLSNGRRQWLQECLQGASRYRLALKSAAVAERKLGTHHDAQQASSQAALDAVRERAAGIAARVRLPQATPRAEPLDLDLDALPRPLPALIRGALEALAQIDAATASRDRTRVPAAAGDQRALEKVVSRRGLHWRSTYVRHALRVALGMALMLVLVTRLPPGDSLAITSLMMTFGILQVSWRATLAKAKDRVIGLIGGGIAATLIVLLLPPSTYVYIAGAAVLAGLWFVPTSPKLGYALFVVVSIEMGTSLRGRDPFSLLGEYVLLTVAAVVIGVVVGFAVVPGHKPLPLAERVRAALDHTSATCAALALGHRRTSPELMREAHQAAETLDLLPTGRENLSEEQSARLEDLTRSLVDLLTVAVTLGGSPTDNRHAMGSVTRALRNEPDPAHDDAPPGEPGLPLADIAHELALEARAAADDLVGPQPSQG
ncbi:hypothetical protein JT358_13780 [Micrococcales bacterium 31B]|nr:hypothetical protein [Micrococcales bacterium 31B]